MATGTDQSFVNQLIEAMIQGKEYAHQNKRREWEEEDRGIEKDLLSHRLRDLKIQDRLRARNAAMANLEALEGQPEASFPRNATDADMTRVTPGLPGTVPREGMVQPNVPTVNIPGIDELGVPGVSRKPNTLEQILAMQLAELKQKAMWTPRNVSRGGKTVIPGMAGEDGADEDGVVAEGEDFPERLYQYRNYDPATGKTTVEMLTADEFRDRPPAVQRPPSSSGNGITRATDEEMEEVAQGFVDGSTPADLVPNATSDFNVRLLSSIKRLGKASGFDLTRARNDQRAFRTYLNTLNGAEQQKLSQASDLALATLDELDEIVKKAQDPSMWTPGTKPTLDMKAKADLVREQLALLKSGGSNALNKALEQAEKEFSTGLFSGKLGAKITRLRANLRMRINSVRGSFIGAGDVTGPERPGAAGADPNDPLAIGPPPPKGKG